ncbi:hypothetical protein HA402_003011 [Bradysia odoriphaga]|nr:hypothetical protein HA402_003011 [Bradysia odoriphaga]
MAWSKPGVEIEEQRLLKIPQSYPRHQATEQNSNTKKILSEIERINIEFGYLKKEPQVSPRIDLESYFYPRPAYHPTHQRYNNGMVLPPKIRQLSMDDESSQFNPFNTQTFYYPTPYLQVPYAEAAQPFQRVDKSQKFGPSSAAMTSGNVENDFLDFAPQYDPNRMQGKLVRDFIQEKALVQAVKKIVSEIKDNNKSQQLDTAVIINKIEEESRTSHKQHHHHRGHTSTQNHVTKKHKTKPDDGEDSIVIYAQPVKENLVTVTPQLVATTPQLVTTSPQSTTIQGKFFTRPKPKPLTNITANLLYKTTESPPPVVSNIEPSAEKEEAPLGKGPFSSFLNSQKEQVLEALREGGIIIQRLRVKEGGIAIAGPGGVATAGSGGTAIVGPGGIALTHPRSLAIAGPGAKVIAVPENVDLARLALRSNARQLPIEGEVVATGPIIYYNPPTTT